MIPPEIQPQPEDMDHLIPLDGWCVECGEEFHLDDTGGYNPPCPCGCGLCRSCHDAEKYADAEWEDDEAPEDSGLGEGGPR